MTATTILWKKLKMEMKRETKMEVKREMKREMKKEMKGRGHHGRDEQWTQSSQIKNPNREGVKGRRKGRACQCKVNVSDAEMCSYVDVTLGRSC